MNSVTVNNDAFIEQLIQAMSAESQDTQSEAVETFLSALEAGTLRCAVRSVDGNWQVEPRVKQLILRVFKLGRLEAREDSIFQFCDKHNLWPNQQNLPERGIRIVPGGSSIRRGAYIARGVTVMPPSYINIGASVDEGSMIDSHATVGSCAQIGKRCHISAAAQIGGVLEPVGALPVIVENDAFVGGNVGIYEGTRVGQGAVIASGTILTRSTPIFDLVNECIIRAENGVLCVPPNAVVVSGARSVKTAFGNAHGLSLYTPVIVKYRDEKTDATTVLESILHVVD